MTDAAAWPTIEFVDGLVLDEGALLCVEGDDADALESARCGVAKRVRISLATASASVRFVRCSRPRSSRLKCPATRRHSTPAVLSPPGMTALSGAPRNTSGSRADECLVLAAVVPRQPQAWNAGLDTIGENAVRILRSELAFLLGLVFGSGDLAEGGRRHLLRIPDDHGRPTAGPELRSLA